MLDYIVLVNKEKSVIIIDYKTDDKNCQPDVGYKSDCCDWSTNNKEYMQNDDIFFDKEKAFKETGIYEIIGYDNSSNTPEGFNEDYMVKNIIKIAELPY